VPFDSLNLALVGDDDPDAVRRNLDLLLEDFAPGRSWPTWSRCTAARWSEAGGPREQCDALVSDRADVVLMVRVADCVPVLLADPDGGVIGAAHSGRTGPGRRRRRRVRRADATRSGASDQRVDRADTSAAAATRSRELRAGGRRGRAGRGVHHVVGDAALDIGAGVGGQLERLGVEVHDVSRCTLESPDLYSHRRDGARAGRWPA
jgi:copper oxidase (laccase) domain-containing protein